MQTVRKKSNVPSANWSKFLYIFYRHHFNFQTKMRFLGKEQKSVLWRRGLIFRFCANVCRVVMMRRQRNHHCLKWIQSSLEGKKNLICCRLFTASKKIPIREFYSLIEQQRQINPTKKACATMYVQSVQSNVMLVKNKCFNFLTLLKLSNKVNLTNISFLFMVFYIIS